MTDNPYTDSESKLAKKLRKLARDELGECPWPHKACVRMIRRYGPERAERRTEEFLAWVFEKETAKAARDQ